VTDPAPHARVLSNGRYAVLITSAGTGYSTWNGYALTTWTADRTEDGEGFFIYLRNLERNQLWSIGYQPARKPADAYAASYEPGRVRIERLDDGIESRLEVCVAPGDDVEIRRVSLRNVSNQPQHLELTSYAELALNHPAAHAAHPAFSKLFVQTEYAAPGILLAHRRPRARDEEAPWIMHALLGTGPLQYDTDRARFIGRGRDLAHPIALTTGTLAGVVGNVLDPVFSLRRSARLGVGDTAHFTLLLGVARNRAAVIELAARYSEAAVVQAAFDGAGEQEQSPPSALADTPPLRASTSSPRAMGDSISKKNSAHPEPVEGSATKKSTVSSEQSESGRAAGTQSLLFDNGYAASRRTDASTSSVSMGAGPRCLGSTSSPTKPSDFW
jgi:cyclic beta-1,2-glucan synthetase